jgi:hypothetical protein
MATTSTRDSTTWTTRRVQDRWLAVGGACSTITLISSNDRFQYRLDLAEALCKTGSIGLAEPLLRTG